MELEEQGLNPRDIVKHVVRTAIAATRERNISIQAIVADDVPTLVIPEFGPAPKLETGNWVSLLVPYAQFLSVFFCTQIRFVPRIYLKYPSWRRRAWQKYVVLMGLNNPVHILSVILP
jgi:hypothetical protein